MESMRNEYEAKIYELSEDLHLLNKTLLQKELNKGDNMQSQHDQFDLLQELNEKNEKLTNDIKQVGCKKNFQNLIFSYKYLEKK